MTERRAAFVLVTGPEVERKQSQMGCNLSKIHVSLNCKKGRNEEIKMDELKKKKVERKIGVNIENGMK